MSNQSFRLLPKKLWERLRKQRVTIAAVIISHTSPTFGLARRSSGTHHRAEALQARFINDDFGQENTEKKQPVKLMTSQRPLHQQIINETDGSCLNRPEQDDPSFDTREGL